MVDNSHGKESEVSICLKNYTVKSSISPRKQRVSPMDLLQSLMINAWQCRQFHFGIFLQQNKIRCVFILNTIAASKSGTLPGLGLNHTLWVLSMNLPRPQPDRNISKTMVQHLSKPSPHFLVGESILGKYWKSRKYKGMTNVIKRDVWNTTNNHFIYHHRILQIREFTLYTLHIGSSNSNDIVLCGFLSLIDMPSDTGGFAKTHKGMERKSFPSIAQEVVYDSVWCQNTKEYPKLSNLLMMIMVMAGDGTVTKLFAVNDKLSAVLNWHTTLRHVAMQQLYRLNLDWSPFVMQWYAMQFSCCKHLVYQCLFMSCG